MARRHRGQHDVVIVGARVAGAATAMLLARLGHDVVMVDRADCPSDTISTHQIARPGSSQLHRWGLLDDVLASGAPALRQVTFHCRRRVDHATSQGQVRRRPSGRATPVRPGHDPGRRGAGARGDVRTGVTVDGVRLRRRRARDRGVRARPRRRTPWRSTPDSSSARTGCGRGWPVRSARPSSRTAAPAAPRSTRTTPACRGTGSSSITAHRVARRRLPDPRRRGVHLGLLPDRPTPARAPRAGPRRTPSRRCFAAHAPAPGRPAAARAAHLGRHRDAPVPNHLRQAHGAGLGARR